MEQTVAKMIDIPSHEKMPRFYSALAVAGIGTGLEVRDAGKGRGKGIYASKRFEEGDVVLIEPPLVASQDTANKADALVCAHCFQYVGSIELQIGRRLTCNLSTNQLNEGDKVAAEANCEEGPELRSQDNGETQGLESRVSENGHEAAGSESGEGRLTDVRLTDDRSTDERLTGEGLNDERLSEERLSGLDGSEERNGGGGHCCEDDESEDERLPADPKTVTALLGGTLKLPLSAQFPLPELVECFGGCSENLYCSSKCRDISWEAHHKLLCVGPRSEAADVEALRAFNEFADVSNNIFHVAAQVVATTVLRARQGGGPTIPEHLVGGSDLPVEDEGTWRSTEAGSDAPLVSGRAGAQVHNSNPNANPNAGPNSKPDPNPKTGLIGEQTGNKNRRAPYSEPFSDSNSDALLRAWEPFSMGWKGVWWESVACPPEMAEHPAEEAAFRTSIRELCKGSLELLRTAFGREAETLRPLFSLEVYSRIIGMFELNNLALVVPSPVENYFLAIDGLPENEKQKVESVTKPLLDALGRGYATHCEGTAFYTLQSCANHSCDPNARGFKREEDVNGHAVLLANRRIEKAEEITISYIDEADDYVDRQGALADYGFVCHCSRCEKELLST